MTSSSINLVSCLLLPRRLARTESSGSSTSTSTSSSTRSSTASASTSSTTTSSSWELLLFIIRTISITSITIV